MMFAIIETAMIFFADAGAGDRHAGHGAADHDRPGADRRHERSHSSRPIFATRLSDCSIAPAASTSTSRAIRRSRASTSTTRSATATTSTRRAISPGSAGDIVVVRTFYQWPVFVTGLGYNPGNLNGDKRLLVADRRLPQRTGTVLMNLRRLLQRLRNVGARQARRATRAAPPRSSSRIITPAILALFFGTAELSQGVAIDRKVTITARSLSDLVAQSTTVSDADMTNIFNAASAIMTPYSDVAAEGEGVGGQHRRERQRDSRLERCAATRHGAREGRPCHDSDRAEDRQHAADLERDLLRLHAAGRASTSPERCNLTDQFFARPRQSSTICRVGDRHDLLIAGEDCSAGFLRKSGGLRRADPSQEVVHLIAQVLRL